MVQDQRPVAHVAKELGISRQCAHRWVGRFRREGLAGLVDRSSRPRRSPTRTAGAVEHDVIELRRAGRRGPQWLAEHSGVPARSVSRILARHGVSRLADCDPLTGQPIQASRASTVRYEREHPCELVHMDVTSAWCVERSVGPDRLRDAADPVTLLTWVGVGMVVLAAAAVLWIVDLVANAVINIAN